MIGTLFAGFLLLAPGCSRHEFPTHTITLGDTTMLVEVAADPEQRAKGLMYRQSLPANEGMLFVYPEQRKLSFWMKDTRVPLSIAFLNRHGKIMRIADMSPLDTDSTKSVYPSLYAIEVNKGWFAEHGITRGMRVTDLPNVTAQ